MCWPPRHPVQCGLLRWVFWGIMKHMKVSLANILVAFMDCSKVSVGVLESIAQPYASNMCGRVDYACSDKGWWNDIFSGGWYDRDFLTSEDEEDS